MLGLPWAFFSQKPKSIWFLVGETIFWLDTLEHYFRSSPEKQFGLLAWVVIQDGDLWSTRQNDAYQRRNFTLFISFRLGSGSAQIARTFQASKMACELQLYSLRWLNFFGLEFGPARLKPNFLKNNDMSSWHDLLYLRSKWLFKIVNNNGWEFAEHYSFKWPKSNIEGRFHYCLLALCVLYFLR